MKKLIFFVVLIGYPAFAQAQQQPFFNPSGVFSQNYSVIVDPVTGLQCAASAPCAIFGTRITGNMGAAFDAPTSSTAPPNAILIGSQYVKTAPAPTANQLNVPLMDAAESFYVDGEIRSASYSAAFTVVPATGVFAQICGNAAVADHIRLREIDVDGTATTAGGSAVTITKTSTAASGGTGTAQTIGPLDNNNSASGAVVTAYTGAPAAGTLVTNLYGTYQYFPTIASSPSPIVRHFGAPDTQAVVLIGTTQCLALALGTPPTGATEYVTMIWSEDSSN